MSETVAMTLTDFLLARIAEDEAAAQYEYVLNADPAHFPIYYEGRAFWPGRGKGLPMGREEYENLLRAAFDVRTEVTDARVLAECEAKRRIVDYREQATGGSRQTGLPIFEAQVSAYDATLRALALPYADHPEYREEWRP